MKPPSIPVLRDTYTPPRLRRGNRTLCLVRDCTVAVTGWSDAPIPWPLCRRLGSGAFPGILVDEELARAVKRESAVAIMHWWGVSKFTVIKWRKALGANRQNNEGSQMLIHAAMAKARDVVERNGLTEQTRLKHRHHALRQRIWELAPKVTHGVSWTPAHLALLGTMSDREVASLTGHPYFSVKTQRQRMRIPAFECRG